LTRKRNCNKLETVVKYSLPHHWILYRPTDIVEVLTDAKAAVATLKNLPYQRDWVEALQKVQLKREVAGTSRIEGAEFTDKELDAAMEQTPNELFTRSQRQAHAAKLAYRWVATIPDDRPLSLELIRDLHRLIVTGADDDHCPPGRLRETDLNVTFGIPRHRGVEGGAECQQAVQQLCQATNGVFREHDPLIRALAIHYHFAAMHPFLDGNGRSARALEALFLQRAGLKDIAFIAMSNFYYDEKAAYLGALSEVRAREGDLTAFLRLGLRGISLQCRRLCQEIEIQIRKALFRNRMHELYGRLQSPRKRVIGKRQVEILELLLAAPLPLDELYKKAYRSYSGLRSEFTALIRDITQLADLGAIEIDRQHNPSSFRVRLDWPAEITETEFFQRIKRMPKVKSLSFL
jgi:Fic family protein